MKTFTVDSNTNLKDFTSAVYPQGAFALGTLLRGKDIKVNGARVGANVPLKAGDSVVYYTTPKQEEKPSHEIRYEDENVYIADKFSGVSSEGLLSELCRGGEFYAVHRLDRNTQGLIVFAKNRAAEAELLAAFKDRGVEKTYIALCKNKFIKGSGLLTAYLKKDASASLVKVFKRPAAGTVKIVTQYELIENRGDVALVKIILHTGKTHQIRAHLAFIGCPVLGDEKYGDGVLNKKYHLTRQCLIAKHLKFSLNDNLKYLNDIKFESSFKL